MSDLHEDLKRDLNTIEDQFTSFANANSSMSFNFGILGVIAFPASLHFGLLSLIGSAQASHGEEIAQSLDDLQEAIEDHGMVSIDTVVAAMSTASTLDKYSVAYGPAGVNGHDISRGIEKAQDVVFGIEHVARNGLVEKGWPVPDIDGDGFVSLPDVFDRNAGAGDLTPPTQEQIATINSILDSFTDGNLDQSGENGIPDDEDADSIIPIVIDLDLDGVEFGGWHTAPVAFDIDADGFLEQVRWISGDDAFLVIDLAADGTSGPNGTIDQANELIFANWTTDPDDTDLQALSSEFDTNNDHIFSTLDARWSEFRLWQDIDSNGKVDVGELKTLADHGITQIYLTYDNGALFDDASDDISYFGNTLHGSASYVKDSETIVGGVGDVSLVFDALGWREIETNLGFSIEFETGLTQEYAELDGTGSSGVDFSVTPLDGAFGDERNNNLNADQYVRSVTIGGGAGSDQIFGGANDDLLAGGEGADHILGGDGNDVIFFDAADTLVGGGPGYDVAIVASDDAINDFDLSTKGFEAAYGGIGADTLYVSSTFSIAVALHGGEGNDDLTGGAGGDTLSGDEGDDILTANSGDDAVVGGAGDDDISGNNGDDLIMAGSGADTASGGDGDDTIFGGDDDDVLHGDDGDDFIDGGDGNDVIHGWYGDDTIYGGDGNDTISGNWGDDYINGGAGDDYIRLIIDDNTAEGGDGNDTIYGGVGRGNDYVSGGNGNDVYIVNAVHSASSGYDIFEGGLGTDTLRVSGAQTDWTIRNDGHGRYRVINAQTLIQVKDVEQIEFIDEGVTITLGGADPLAIGTVELERQTGGMQVNSVHDNTVYLHLGANHYNYSSGNDTIYADAARDYWTWDPVVEENVHIDEIIYETQGGADVVNAGSGDDYVHAGGGNDQVFASGGDDTVEGADGNDWLLGNTGSDQINGGNGGDTIEGGSGADLLVGDAGDDIINGASGFDVINGGDGNDTLSGGSGSDFINGGNGADTIDGGSNSDNLKGGDGADTINGGDGGDSITGGHGNDTLHGDNDGDVVRGGGGNDTIWGGSGNDRLDGDGQIKDLTWNQYNDWDADDFARHYVASNPDLIGVVAPNGVGAVNHYNDTGRNEGLRADFNGLVYVASHGDLINAFRHAGGGTSVGVSSRGALHYVQWGHGEGRKLDDFNPIQYLMNYADLRAAYIDNDSVDLSAATLHYIKWGHTGGRSDGTNVAGALTQEEWTHLIEYDGNDSLYGQQGADVLDGGEGDDYLNGGDNSDILFGDVGNDTLIGGNAADILEGGAGADIIHGGHGDPTMIGDHPLDLAAYTTSDAGVIVSLEHNVAVGGHAQGDELSEIESLEGSAFDDVLKGQNPVGSPGDANYVNGTNYLYGGAGNDQLFGFGGHDLLFGNEDDDELYGQDGIDTLVGGIGNDLVVGGNDDDRLFGDEGDDNLIGGPGDDDLTGGEGSDRLEGAGGTDTARYVTADAGLMADLEYQHLNNGDALGDTFISVENLEGTGHDDQLRGDGGDNLILGGAGDDIIHGRWGNDTLNGGFGNDDLYGGGDTDHFVFERNFGADKIFGFGVHVNETIDFSDVHEITDFADLAANHLTQIGSDVVITAGTNTLTLIDRSTTDLDALNFVF